MKTVLVFTSIGPRNLISQIEGISGYARKAGWHVQLVDQANSPKLVKAALDFWKPIGVIVEYGTQWFSRCCRTFGSLPRVQMDLGRKPIGRGYYVGNDSPSIGRLAAAHLLELGYRDYAYFPFNHDIIWCRERGDAFAAAIKAGGANFHRFRGNQRQNAAHRNQALVKWLRELPKPCGIMAACDINATEVLSAAAYAKISVPDEIAVLGVENDQYLCDNSIPTLSSVDPDVVRVGYNAAVLLDRLVKGEAVREGMYSFPAERVVRRASTRKWSRDGELAKEACEFIRQNACKGISVTDVAGFMRCGLRLAQIRFKAANGRSILSTILEERLAKVRELLVNSNLQISAIYAKCGFSSDAALRKQFRQRHGMSLRDYRKMHRKGEQDK